MTPKKQPGDEVRLAAPLARASITPRNPYSPYTPSRSLDYGPTLTKQAFADECDINLIVKRYAQTGQITHLANRLGEFADVENIDFQTAQNLIVKANELFAQIPAKIRAEFGHNSGEFLKFALNPASAPELAAMGLIDEGDTYILQGLKDRPQAKIEPLGGTPSPTQPGSESS